VGSTALPPGGGSVVLNATTGTNFTYKWFNGSSQVGTDASSYTATTVGSYMVEITNASGCKMISSTIDVTSASNQPSIVTIISPAANATIAGTITISATITDPDGNISLVEYLDGNTVIGSSTTGPYTFDWTNPDNGTHTITIRVTDSNGGITTSSPVTVTSTTTTSTLGLNSISATLYPNPANGYVFVETEMDLSNATFTLVNVLGEEKLLDASLNSNGAQLDVSNLQQGAYVLIITDDTSVIRKKITVTR
ncbi:MAG: Ig-like domain-containing protein, partial [Bacteroidia bacterium]